MYSSIIDLIYEF